jgi:hypothetical protein
MNQIGVCVWCGPWSHLLLGLVKLPALAPRQGAYPALIAHPVADPVLCANVDEHSDADLQLHAHLVLIVPHDVTCRAIRSFAIGPAASRDKGSKNANLCVQAKVQASIVQYSIQ